MPDVKRATRASYLWPWAESNLHTKGQLPTSPWPCLSSFCLKRIKESQLYSSFPCFVKKKDPHADYDCILPWTACGLAGVLPRSPRHTQEKRFGRHQKLIAKYLKQTIGSCIIQHPHLHPFTYEQEACRFRKREGSAVCSQSKSTN